MPACLPACRPACRPARPPTRRPAGLPTRLPARPPAGLPVRLPASVHNVCVYALISASLEAGHQRGACPASHKPQHRDAAMPPCRDAAMPRCRDAARRALARSRAVSRTACRTTQARLRTPALPVCRRRYCGYRCLEWLDRDICEKDNDRHPRTQSSQLTEKISLRKADQI